jgi:predicted GNAT family acetyltransferase
MLIEFSRKDIILDSKPFTDDEVQFNLLHLIRDGRSPLLRTNKNKSIIMGQSEYKYPVWIWTSNQITNDDIEELKNDFVDIYKNMDMLTFVAKPNIAEVLAEHYSICTERKYSVHLQMESFFCLSVIKPKLVQGYFRKATIDDINTISEFLSGFIYDCFGKITTPKQQVQNAMIYIENKNLYVWCNDNEIISMANIAHRSERNVRINEVYTRKDMRGKGFGARIVYELCKVIINEQKVPVLYTDLANPASNKAYKNIGFIESGKITQILFDK